MSAQVALLHLSCSLACCGCGSTAGAPATYTSATGGGPPGGWCVPAIPWWEASVAAVPPQGS